MSFLPLLVKQHLLIRSDNTTAISYIAKMAGMIDYLHDKITRCVWQLAYENGFWILISHIPRISNLADKYSRDLNLVFT